MQGTSEILEALAEGSGVYNDQQARAWVPTGQEVRQTESQGGRCD